MKDENQKRRSKARNLWNGWSVEERIDFLKFHNLSSDLAKQTWMTLPYTLKELLIWKKPGQDISEIPRITGQCSSCKTEYNITMQTACPSCGNKGLNWAVQDNIPELDSGEKLDVNELYRMWKLEDKRR